MSTPHSLEFSIHIFDRLASTNQTLWELIDSGAPPGTVVIANEQTAGRGQWGRQWQSATGGLYLSLAIATNLPASSSAQLTLCSAWGIAAYLRGCQIPVFIKWPNDLLLANRKLGGILTETRMQGGTVTKVVVGVGINWANPVPINGIGLQPFLANQCHSKVQSLEMLAALTLQGIASGYQRVLYEGIENLLPSYLELLTNIGQPLTVKGDRGVVVGVTTTGELRVNCGPHTESDKQMGNDNEIVQAGASTLEIFLKPGTISLGYEQDPS